MSTGLQKLIALLKPVPRDPFEGGRRNKGEKKRAARQRRVRGGY